MTKKPLITPPRKAAKSPLTCHPRGGLVRKFKIQGVWQHISFGRWKYSKDGIERPATGSEIDDAIRRYQVELPYWAAGVEPPEDLDGVEIIEIVTPFGNWKAGLKDLGELAESTLKDYREVSQNLIDHFGAHRLADKLMPLDWLAYRQAIVEYYSPVRARKIISITCSIFEWAVKSEIIPTWRPGPALKPPTAPQPLDVGRKRMFHAKEIHKMLEGIKEIRKAIDGKKLPLKPPRIIHGKEVKQGRWTIQETDMLQVWILLGVNCGFNGADCGNIEVDKIHIDDTWGGDGWHKWVPKTWTGWHHYPRRKTKRFGTPRSCPLWTETRDALRACKLGSVYCFETRQGNPYDEYVGKTFRSLLDYLEMHSERMGFSWFRHTFETAASGCRDQIAVDYIMGHRAPGMAATYREGIDPQRLVDVVQYVHRWLF